MNILGLLGDVPLLYDWKEKMGLPKFLSSKTELSGPEDKSCLMQRRHFELIAKTLKNERPGANWDPNKLVMWNQIVKGLSDTFRTTNPNFNS